jgi:ABC-2 type transport system ATP-binding protein
MNSTIALRTERLVKRRADYCLGPVDLALEHGYTYALVGPNGTGKTTLLTCCMNLTRPTSGKVELFGRSYETGEAEIRTYAAFVPDPLEGCESFTLLEMEKFIGRWYERWDGADYRRRAERFRIPLHKPYGRLSQGDRKKAALTLALSTRAPLLLLDEPTNGLDLASRSQLKHMLVEDSETMERTVLMSTHSVEDIRQFADYILLLKEGRVEGPYDKDSLSMSWRRLWLTAPATLDMSAVPGALEWREAPVPNLITRDRDAALTYLEENGVQVTSEQPLPLDELLERLLQL